MTKIKLPVSGGEMTLSATLSLVEEMEDACGSLFKAAEDLLQGELCMGKILTLLHIVYKAAGSAMTREELAVFYLHHCPRPCSAVLSDVLVKILTPLYGISAVREDAALPGEDQAAGAAST
jgi:hypothetical protein